MKPIVKIFQIESNEKYIELSKIEQYEIKYLGNGFFISKNGYLASVAHVLYNNEVINSYIFYEDKLQKINIIERKFTEKNSNHIDAAIGKIDVNKDADFFNPSEFEDVTTGMKLFLLGYSRHLNNGIILNDKESILKFKLQKLNSFCININFLNSNEHITMYNFFEFDLDNVNLCGMSGSPIINERNKILGIFKGGEINMSKIYCQAIHIKIIKNMFNKSPAGAHHPTSA